MFISTYIYIYICLYIYICVCVCFSTFRRPHPDENAFGKLGIKINAEK